MSSLWSSNEYWSVGLGSYHNRIVDALMESCWPGEPQRDDVLATAIGRTLGYMAHCQLLAKRFSTETDERLVTTAKVVRQSEEVSHNTWIALKCWKTGDLHDLQATVEACVLACDELHGNLRQYHSEMYPVDRDGTISPDTMFDMRKTDEATVDCQIACEMFLETWMGVEVPE
jgi:hypothetical protein